MLYSSKENKKIKEIHKLQMKKYRDSTNKFLVEGYHLVEEAYKTNALEEVILLEGEEVNFNVETITVTKEVMHYLSDLDSMPRILGVCKQKEKKDALGNFILALDNIQDPGNLGTIIRSSKAFSVSDIILSEDTVDIYNPKVIRSSQGMIFKVPFSKENLYDKLSELKKLGYKIVGTKVDGGKSLKEYKPNEKIVIIMGNEGNGMSEDISSLCDEFLYIPMNPDCESLNVGVAASIILYALRSE